MYLVNFLSYGRRYSLALLAGVLVVFTLQSCTAAETFNNSDSSVIPKTLGDVIEWRMTKDPSPELADAATKRAASVWNVRAMCGEKTAEAKLSDTA